MTDYQRTAVYVIVSSDYQPNFPLVEGNSAIPRHPFGGVTPIESDYNNIIKEDQSLGRISSNFIRLGSRWVTEGSLLGSRKTIGCSRLRKQSSL